MSLVTWYRINDLPAGQEVIGDVNNRHLGIVDLQGRPKPALEGFRRAAELFSRPLRPADDRILVTRPIASRAEVHGFEAADGSLTIVAWQRASAPVMAAAPRPARNRRGRPRPSRSPFPAVACGRPPTRRRIDITYRDDATAIRLGVTQDHTLIFRLILY